MQQYSQLYQISRTLSAPWIDRVARKSGESSHKCEFSPLHNEGDPIPPQEQESIFKIYQRAETVRQGLKQGWGIGLPYVRAVAESHAGSVALDSSAERGTTFMVDIPVDVRPFLNAPTLA